MKDRPRDIWDLEYRFRIKVIEAYQFGALMDNLEISLAILAVTSATTARALWLSSASIAE
jgi:hypothetical protein